MAKEFNKKQLKVLSDNFRLNEDRNYITIESWTDLGADMVFYIDKNSKEDYIDQFQEYIDNFDIDECIDCFRQDVRYKTAFKISESVKDFESYLKDMKNILKKLKQL